MLYINIKYNEEEEIKVLVSRKGFFFLLQPQRKYDCIGIGVHSVACVSVLHVCYLCKQLVFIIILFILNARTRAIESRVHVSSFRNKRNVIYWCQYFTAPLSLFEEIDQPSIYIVSIIFSRISHSFTP